MQTYRRYDLLKKPSWSPPAWIFGPVWSVLYLLIAVSFGAAFVMAFREEISWLIALPFLLNLIFNAAYTPLEFKLKSNTLASIDIVLVLATLIWAMIVIFPIAPWIMYLQIPYLVWVSFATCLQLTITYLNAAQEKTSR